MPLLINPSITNLYQAFPQIMGQELSYVLPPNYFIENGNLTVRINNVYTKNVILNKDAGSINAATSSSPTSKVNLDFSLAWLNGPSVNLPNGGTEATAIARVTIKGSTALCLDKPLRQQLKTSLLVFYEQLEDLELNKNYLASGGAQAILRRVVEALPLSFSEVLAYHYNLSPTERFIDLQAGMRLRVDFAANQFVAPGSELNGFVGTGTSFYEVSRLTDTSGTQKLCFNPFLATLLPLAIPPSTSGIASIIELQSANNARRYWRLIYPSQMPISTTSNIGIGQNVLLLGADTLSTLNKATATYLASADYTTPTDNSSPILYFFFRGRSVIIPEIMVNLDGTPTYVPLGTTVRNLMDRCINASFAVRNTSTGINNATMRVARTWTDGSDNLSYKTVQFNMLSKDAPLTSLDSYNLPLIKGDLISFNKN